MSAVSQHREPPGPPLFNSSTTGQVAAANLPIPGSGNSIPSMASGGFGSSTGGGSFGQCLFGEPREPWSTVGSFEQLPSNGGQASCQAPPPSLGGFPSNTASRNPSKVHSFAGTTSEPSEIARLTWTVEQLYTLLENRAQNSSGSGGIERMLLSQFQTEFKGAFANAVQQNGGTEQTGGGLLPTNFGGDYFSAAGSPATLNSTLGRCQSFVSVGNTFPGTPSEVSMATTTRAGALVGQLDEEKPFFGFSGRETSSGGGFPTMGGVSPLSNGAQLHQYNNPGPAAPGAPPTSSMPLSLHRSSFPLRMPTGPQSPAGKMEALSAMSSSSALLLGGGAATTAPRDNTRSSKDSGATVQSHDLSSSMSSKPRGNTKDSVDSGGNWSSSDSRRYGPPPEAGGSLFIVGEHGGEQHQLSTVHSASLGGSNESAGGSHRASSNGLRRLSPMLLSPHGTGRLSPTGGQQQLPGGALLSTGEDEVFRRQSSAMLERAAGVPPQQRSLRVPVGEEAALGTNTEEQSFVVSQLSSEQTPYSPLTLTSPASPASQEALLIRSAPVDSVQQEGLSSSKRSVATIESSPVSEDVKVSGQLLGRATGEPSTRRSLEQQLPGKNTVGRFWWT